MKKTTQKKLSAFIIAAMMFSVNAYSQIIYTDVIPDSTSQGSYSLDLNNDGIPDFLIAHTTSSGACSHINNYIKISPQNGSKCSVKKLATGEVISSSLSYSAAGNQGMAAGVWYFGCYYGGSGTWGVATGYITGGYLALELVVSGNTYYGWARLSTYLFANGFTIRDYAYNSNPNQPILAGETSCAAPITLLAQSGPLSFCAGDSVTLTANGTGYLYQWKRNGVSISGATSQTYVAKSAGTYKVKVTNSCGSKTSKADTIIVPCRNADASFLSMTNTDELEHLSVYPNPATNSVTIKFPSDEEGEIQIVNLFGCIVETHNYASLRDGTFQIDVSKYSPGMYVVRWNCGENYQTQKFSVTH